MGINKYKIDTDINTTKMAAFNRINYEIRCAKVEQHVTLERDRKIGQLQQKDGALRQLLQNAHPSPDSVIGAANDCIELLKYVEGANIVIRNIKILKEQSLNVEQMVKNRQPLGELEPLVHTVVWSTKRLNQKVIEEFNNLMCMYFNPQMRQVAVTSQFVDLEIKRHFESLMAKPEETHDYLTNFCNRNNIDTMVLLQIWPSQPTPMQTTPMQSNYTQGPPIPFNPQEEISIPGFMDQTGMTIPNQVPSSSDFQKIGVRVSELRRIG